MENDMENDIKIWRMPGDLENVCPIAKDFSLLRERFWSLKREEKSFGDIW